MPTRIVNADSRVELYIFNIKQWSDFKKSVSISMLSRVNLFEGEFFPPNSGKTMVKLLLIKYEAGETAL